MTNLMSKSSLYDTVSMIVPGFITLFSFAKIFGQGSLLPKIFGNGDYSVPRYICIFAFSYLVGMIIHYISRWLYDPRLRNNPKDIGKTEIRFKRYKEEPSMLDGISSVFRCHHKNSTKDRTTIDNYYKKYYQVIESSSSVPIMEAQVSFIRSMLIVFYFVIAFFVLYFIGSRDFPDLRSLLKDINCSVLVIFVLLTLLCVLKCLMFYIQNRIYYRIFEDHYYMYGEGQCSKTTKTETTTYSTVTPSTITTATSVTTFDENNKLEGNGVIIPMSSNSKRKDRRIGRTVCMHRIMQCFKNIRIKLWRTTKQDSTSKPSKQKEKKEKEKVASQNTQNK